MKISLVILVVILGIWRLHTSAVNSEYAKCEVTALKQYRLERNDPEKQSDDKLRQVLDDDRARTKFCLDMLRVNSENLLYFGQQ